MINLLNYVEEPGATTIQRPITEENPIRLHVAAAMKDAILSLGYEVSLHPANTFNTVPSDFHLFRSLQHILHSLLVKWQS